MDFREFQAIMDAYQEEQLDAYINGYYFDSSILITYPTSTGIRSFYITNVVYSNEYPGCIEGTCMTNYPEGRTDFTGIDEIDYGTSRRTFSIAKIIRIG